MFIFNRATFFVCFGPLKNTKKNRARNKSYEGMRHLKASRHMKPLVSVSFKHHVKKK